MDNKVSILVVEDEGIVGMELQESLQNEGFEVVGVADNGTEALALIQQNDVDLVLLDINLPKKNGHEVLHFIKTSLKYKQLPVIMLTTSSSGSDILNSYKNYVNCYITKPIEAHDFMNAVAKIEDFWINIVSIPKE